MFHVVRTILQGVMKFLIYPGHLRHGQYAPSYLRENEDIW